MIKVFITEKNWKIKVDTRRGKPIIDKHGHIQIIGGNYYGCTSLNSEEFEKVFKEVT